jgi:3-methyl-2-oxobutanoate hydroxymethyltransferase
MTAGSHPGAGRNDKEHAVRTRTVPAIRARKVGGGSEPLVMVTAYDAPGAKQAHAAGVDMILVGDSLAMVVLGYDDTLQVTVDDIAHHTGAVRRGLAASTADGPAPLVVGDLPWMSYHTGRHDAVRNAAALVRAGAQAVKLEGGRKRVGVVEAIVDAEIPVMGHLGLTPQSIHKFGTYQVRATDPEEADEVRRDARALQDAGVFAIVLEKVPAALAAEISAALDVPVIGIGAGPGCDGQILVTHDMLGLYTRFHPRFVRHYAMLADLMREAFQRFAEDVRNKDFPSEDESY